MNMIINSFRANNKVLPVDDENNNSLDDVVDSSNAGGYDYQFLPDEEKSDTPESEANNNTPDFIPLTEESLKQHTNSTQKPSEPKLTKNQLKYQQAKQKIEYARQEYINAGGDDPVILAQSNRNLGKIRAATILLKNKTVKKSKKNKK